VLCDTNRLIYQVHHLNDALVLVVEGDTATRAALGLMLEHQGAYVIAVGSGQAAFSVLASFQVDVLICDLQLPDGNGFAVLQSLRSITPAEFAPVAIALTVDSADSVRQQAITAGFQACLTKPFDAETLINTIVRYWQRR
jgi:CheY-like chemotaxis protein